MEAVVAAIGIIMTIVDHMVEMAVVTAATVNLNNIQIHITDVNSYFIKPPNFQSSHRQNIINNYKQVEDRRMIVEAVAGAAVMEETEMDGMAHLNLTRDGKNLTEMEVSSSVKRV